MSLPIRLDKFAFMAPTVNALGMVFRSLDKNFDTIQRRVNLPTPSVYAYPSTTQTIGNSVFAAVTLDLTMFDTNHQHDNAVNNTRLTCVTSGKYLIVANADFVPNAMGSRNCNIYLNGTRIIASDSRAALGVGFETLCNNLIPNPLNPGDYVELRVFQDSGGNLNITNINNLTWLAMYKFSE